MCVWGSNKVVAMGSPMWAMDTQDDTRQLCHAEKCA